MNGITAGVLATGNDTRAVEAGAHSHAINPDGRYTSMSHFERDAGGNLVASLELPMPVGLVGGATKVHPAAQAAVKLLEISTAQQLAEVIVAVGLAQNVAACRALVTEGIQRGHMSPHARNIAVATGNDGGRATVRRRPAGQGPSRPSRPRRADPGRASLSRAHHTHRIHRRP
jgi:hydroxymethylglutaryl-CoA reductase